MFCNRETKQEVNRGKNVVFPPAVHPWWVQESPHTELRAFIAAEPHALLPGCLHVLICWTGQDFTRPVCLTGGYVCRNLACCNQTSCIREPWSVKSRNHMLGWDQRSNKRAIPADMLMQMHATDPEANFGNAPCSLNSTIHTHAWLCDEGVGASFSPFLVAMILGLITSNPLCC